MLEFDSPQLKECVRTLRDVDFELAYLALLTLRGLKPLSRWEKALDDRALKFLNRMGLLTEQIRRSVKTGAEVTETVFSVSGGYIRIYRDRFADTPIDKSAGTTRLEGFLFGFPPCCVDRFVRQPYCKNDLDPQLQKILFHWSCPGCKITAAVLPAYQQIHQYVEKA
ncbi:MAG: hypothetical protein ACYS76_01865 [Planctomycetota bacterium]